MTGLVGGTVDASQLSRMVESLDHEPWYESERFEGGEYGLGLQHHGERDPEGFTFWTDGRTAGAIDGAVTNLDELGWSTSTVFERLLRAPDHALAALDGPFTVAVLDATDDRLLLATDKIGSRTPYYSTNDGLAFASGLAPLLHVLDDPAVDDQAVSDLLLLGHMWSDTTLLEDVAALHPASLLEYRDGDVTVRRYWRPDYTPSRPTEAYLHELTNAFQGTVGRTASTLSGDVGLWLSGGLDSRATASELARAYHDGGQFESLTTYTYDANPGNGVNLRLAARTAEALEVPNETVPLDADRFLRVLERVVDLTDGMVKWNTLRNLSAVFNIEHHDPGPGPSAVGVHLQVPEAVHLGNVLQHVVVEDGEQVLVRDLEDDASAGFGEECFRRR